MISGYPRHPSVQPGSTLTLHVSTDQPKFRVEFYRAGKSMTRMNGIADSVRSGCNFPPGPTDQDWGWPAYEYVIPENWPSGAYVAVLVEIDGAGHEKSPDVSSPDGIDAKALFVVRSTRPGEAAILYKLAWGTYHAYNQTGYGSLYGEAVWVPDDPHPGFKLTTRRPGGGTGGTPDLACPPDFYDGSSRRNTFAHWDAPFIAWLEENGYRVDFCTDLDVHQDPNLLTPYRLMLSVGHDEYWSPETRSAIDDYVSGGGNVAYFSGNIASGVIHFKDGDTSFTCAKSEPTPSDPRQWEKDDGLQENRIGGFTCRNTSGWWDGKRDTLGYTVQHAGHWVYKGTGLNDGDVFGADEEFPLISYECDGADFEWRNGVAVATSPLGTPVNGWSARPQKVDGSASFFILGLAELGEGWTTYGQPAVTMGVYTGGRGGIVFQGNTTDWTKIVERNQQVELITRNVLDKLSLASVRVLGPLPGRAGRMLVEVGQMANFHVDISHLATRGDLRFRWEVAGAEINHDDGGASVEAAMPVDPTPVTVSVTVSDDSGPIAFGTRTFLPLTREDSLRLEIVTLIREIASRGADPSMGLTTPSRDPVLASRSLVTPNLAYVRDRAERLIQTASELLDMWLDSGTRDPVIPDLRREWRR